MPRITRLHHLTRLLQNGATHRAEDLAKSLGVTPRTIYRDMESLQLRGVAVIGTRGSGYHMAPLTTLPPLTLTDAEIEALQFGLAITGETTDPELRAAVRSLTAKLDAALPADAPSDRQSDLAIFTGFANTARGLGHLPTLRAAIRGKQKLRLTDTAPDGTVNTHRVRPLRLSHWARIWSLTVWSETAHGFRDIRVDLIETAAALPELFRDEPGKTLADYQP
ncbi:MAG: helix-turn-helix transcriptional regulator [Sulfitobacter sp.]